MEKLKAVHTIEDIPVEYRNSPIEKLLLYHNLGKELKVYEDPELLIAMCMDHRKMVRIPQNFAYVIRSGGTNLAHHDFHVSFAISVGGVQHIVVIGHSDCGMVGLLGKKSTYLEGMVANAGWDRDKAQMYFEKSVPDNEIGDSTHFTLLQTKGLREKYPRVKVAPLMYLVEDNKLYFIEE